MQFSVLYVPFCDTFDSRHLGKHSGPFSHIFACNKLVKMLNFADLCRILHFMWVLGTFRHFIYHLEKQFCGPYFPTHYTSVSLGL